MRRAAVLTYLHADHLGSPVLTTATGVNATQNYRAYGKVRAYSGSFPTRYQFTGQYKDDSNLTPFVPLPHWLSPRVDPLTDGGRGDKANVPGTAHTNPWPARVLLSRVGELTSSRAGGV